MRRRTKYPSFQAMLVQSPFRVESASDFEAIPDVDWHAYVRANTSFSGWEEMLGEAGKEFFEKKLFS